MNEFVYKVLDRYGLLRGNKCLFLLNEAQDLISDARSVRNNGANKSFHQKFLFFLESFTKATRSVSEVYYHVRNNENIWSKLTDNSEIILPNCEQISKVNDESNFFVVDDSLLGFNNLIKNGLNGQKKHSTTFELFGYCDYLIIFNQKASRSKKSIRTLETTINQIKQINNDFLLSDQSKQKVQNLENELLLKDRDLIVTEKNLKRRVYEIHNLLEISNELYSILNLKQLINSALLIIVGQVGCQKAFAFLYDSNHRKYSKRFTKGLGQLELSEMEIAVDHPLVAFFEKSYKPVLVEELKKDKKLKKICENLLAHKIELIAPIVYGERVQGFVGCGALLSDQKFSKNEMDLLNILINIISISVSNAQTYEDVKNLSLTDAMTNLNNYRYFEDRLKEEINRGRRNNTPVSLIMIDIDHFKNYNDTLGHQAGDEALRNLGWILKNAVRDEDIVNRYGGEEFCIILPGIEKDIIQILGERLRSKIEEYPFYKENVQPGGRITVSLGGSCFSDDADNFEDLVYKADQALYKSKNAGRNILTIYSEDM